MILWVANCTGFSYQAITHQAGLLGDGSAFESPMLQLEYPSLMLP